MYKDPEQQKQANREAKARWKAKQGIPSEGIPVGYSKGIPVGVKLRSQATSDPGEPNSGDNAQINQDGGSEAHTPCSSPAWKHTQAYADMIHRLKAWPVARLQDAGQYIPAWKHAGQACPEAVLPCRCRRTA